MLLVLNVVTLSYYVTVEDEYLVMMSCLLELVVVYGYKKRSLYSGGLELKTTPLTL